MQINTDFNVPDFLYKHEKLIFWISGLWAILFFAVGIYLANYYFFILPFALLLAMLAVLNFRILFYILLFVLPVSIESYIGSFGIDLPSEPIVMLLAVCTVLYLISNRTEWQQPAFKHAIFWIILLLFFWSIFTILFSTNIFLSVKYVLAKAWYLLGFLILPMLLLRNKKNIKLFFWCLFIPTFGSVLYVLIRHAFLGFAFDTITKSVHPIYRNHVNYAVFITMLLPFIFLAKTWYPKNSMRHTLLKYSIPIFIIAIYLSYTRGAWLAAIAMPVYFIVLRFNLTKYILVISSIAVVCFSVYILKDNNYLKYSPDYEHTIYHDELAEHLTSTFEMEDMSTVERFYRWIAAVNLFKQHPLVGVGPNNFVSNYKQYTVTAYETYISDNEERSTVHNYFLLLLTEQGLPAMLLFIVLIIAILITAQHTYSTADDEQKKYIVAITLCVVVFLINNTLSDLVEANKVGSLFFMSIALLINFSSSNITLEE